MKIPRIILYKPRTEEECKRVKCKQCYFKEKQPDIMCQGLDIKKREPNNMTKWEYKTCLHKDLNKNGIEGWSAYAVHPFKNSETIYYLKREVGL